VTRQNKWVEPTRYRAWLTLDVRSTTRKENGEMKKGMMAAVGLVLGACVTAQAGYRTETTVEAGEEAHQYVVQIKIIDVARDGKTDVLSVPKLTLKAGEEGKITVGDENGYNGVFCTARVKEIEGGVEAVTTVVVKEKGAEKLNTAQSVTLKK
jgi:Flp pilus assembly secretin CpaC